MTTVLQKLPWQRDWLGKRTSRWGRPRGGWTPRPTWRSSGSGNPVGFTKNIYAKWYSTMPLPPSKSECDCAIHQGRWEPLVEQDVEREPTVMEFIQPDSYQEDIAELYCDVYQLQRLLGKIYCDMETEACICQEIMDSVKECIWHEWPSALPEAELRWSPANIPRLDSQVEFNTRNHATYDRSMGNKQDSYKEALAMARDTHQWALAVTALLEDKIERMSHPLSCSCWHSASHSHLDSCQQRRSQTADCQTKVPQVMSCHGDPARRWAQSPSSSQLRQWVTFTHSSPKRDISVKEPHLLTWGNERGPSDKSHWSRPKVEDLECLSPLEPHVQEFLRGEEVLLAGTEVGVAPTNLNAWTFPLESTKWIKWICMKARHAILVVGT